MKLKVLWLLLAASIAFNVFFALGAFNTRKVAIRAGTPGGWSEVFADKIGLDEQQKAAYEAWHDNGTAQRRERSTKYRADFDKFWAEIVKDEPDEAVLEEFIQSSQGGDLRRRFVARTRELMEILRPDQRKAAVEMLRSRWRRPTTRTKPKSE